MATSPSYFVRETWLSFKRNWVMSLVAVSIIYLSLLLVGAFFLTSSVVSEIATRIEKDITIQVFLKDGAAQSDVATLQASILTMPNVKGITYVSKEKALERYKEMTKNTPEIANNLRGNPLPASIEVALVDSQKVKDVVDLIVADPTLAKVIKNPADPLAAGGDVNYGQWKGVKKLLAAIETARAVMAGFLILLIAVSLVLIGNTIRLAIYSRRREIGIMRLVGASNWFIRTPFLLEGVLQSLIGSLFALLTLYAALAFVGPWLTQFFEVEVGGAAMAQVAVLRYLKV
jgi:cell division transport system permease protein